MTRKLLPLRTINLRLNERLQSLCYVTWENENIRGLSVGIQYGKGATSSNPHVTTLEPNQVESNSGKPQWQ